MLGNLRERIQTVQNDFTSSLRGLAISPEAKDEMRSKLGFNRNVHKFKVNPNAGSELLQRYQNRWQQMHEFNESNARLAEKVAKAIAQLDNTTKRDDLLMNELLSQLSSLPQIVESIESIEKQLFKTKTNFLRFEQILTNLEISKDSDEFEKLKLDQKNKIEVYREGKASELEALRLKLANEHTIKVQEFERQQQIVLKERQEAFQMAFEDELKRYKTLGKIERNESKESTQSSVPLEEIVIETEKSEEMAFEEFLKN